MDTRTTAMLLLAAVVLGAFIFLYELDDPLPEAPPGAEAGRLIAGVEPGDVEWITLPATDGRRVELRRIDGGWEMISPVRFPADSPVVDAIVRQMIELDVEGVVSGEAGPAAFGLAGEAADAGEIRFEHGGNVEGFRIGRATPVGSNTYVQRIGDEAIAYVATWKINGLQKSSDELRDRKLMDFDRVSVERFRVAWPGGRVGLVKREGEWWLVEPLQARADPDTVENLFSDLAFLRADGFVDEPQSPEALGLDTPALEITLVGRTEDEGEYTRVLEIGGAWKDGLVARGQGGALYLLAPQRLDDFARRTVAYRFKTLSRFEVADARRFELVFAADDELESGEDGSYVIVGEFERHDWVTRPDALDPAGVSGLLAHFARLDAHDILADALGSEERAALGLSPPRLSLRVFDEAGEALADIAFGRAVEGRGLVSMRRGDEQVLLVDPVDAESIPLTLGALREALARPVEADSPAPPGEEALPAL